MCTHAEYIVVQSRRSNATISSWMIKRLIECFVVVMFILHSFSSLYLRLRGLPKHKSTAHQNESVSKVSSHQHHRLSPLSATWYSEIARYWWLYGLSVCVWVAFVLTRQESYAQLDSILRWTNNHNNEHTTQTQPARNSRAKCSQTIISPIQSGWKKEKHNCTQFSWPVYLWTFDCVVVFFRSQILVVFFLCLT